MKRNFSNINHVKYLLAILLFLGWGCKKSFTDLKAPSFPNTPEVFIDGFPSDLGYAAFGGSDVKAFQVDSLVTYNHSAASMRFAVPDANSPNGSYAGGAYYSKTGRNLTGYNALTFYIKASQPATIGVVGFGNDLGANKYLVSLNNLAVNSNWQQVIIPIPDPSKLTDETGLFYYSAGPMNGSGYTFWIDQVTFAHISTLANLTGSIQGGKNDSIPFAISGSYDSITNIQATVNLPTGVNETISISPYYLNFTSSNTSVATVSPTGGVNIVGSGTTLVNATLGSNPVSGSIKIKSIGSLNPPPAPTQDPSNVISLRTSVYPNAPVDYWNGYWQYSTTQSAFAKAGKDSIIQYSNLNFVGAQFSNPTINATGMRRFHLDIYTPDAISANSSLQIELVDFGANGVYGGGDDVSGTITLPASALATNKWISIDTLISGFTGLSTQGHIAQLILVGSNLPDVWIDNAYFWRYPTTPTVAAPTPTQAAANVLSIFSDSYTNVAGTNFDPNWGQSTQVTQVPISGNNTLHYSNFNYQGTQLAANQNVSSYGFLHLDYYTTNATQLRVNLISPGPVQTPFVLNVPTSGWNSVDIPLSAFAPVDLTNVFQISFDNNGRNESSDIYLDNIFFWSIPLTPPVAAPTPTYAAASVISVFSDAYTAALPNINYFPNWGQSTVVSQVSIAGNNTLMYTNLNYEGTQLDPNNATINVSAMNYLHVDYYSGNSSALNVFLISPGPSQQSYTLPVPTASGWNSVDIPLSNFTGVDLTNVFQMMFTGNGTIYLDNIFFHK